MERGLIIGSSGGIGSALYTHLSAQGIDVVGLSRYSDGLDVTDENSIKRSLEALTGSFDLIFVATGALEIDGAEPEKSLSALSAKALADQYAVNAIGPALVLKHAVRLLPKDRRAVFAALSARVGSIGDNRLGGWYSYRAAKTGLNQLIHGASIELARTHKMLCCACLHPGTVETAFTRKYAGRHPTVPAGTAAARLVNVINSLTPEQTGGFYDYAGKEIVW
ncbi:SDR family NAD(P)-dependent oxidoreductase [Tropicibacter naphthalenivorans]|uniref:C signal n=1 Tax=Tropicibacter naphthalenivorans TaxID=441103 RepID=A0A0N7M001_9RHOB|nr:SDR family NAD(P)-dependent oxidoreductase [Tropicibacter naphthalenivorans]CUH79089.1 C signal [Tropicibacter naphthalenivorans]SMD03543.1 NAD(P)-dependent dehydrogenase, short-chain alcohol dehydrogenase family [Tropicibacter naphthalenivorans]